MNRKTLPRDETCLRTPKRLLLIMDSFIGAGPERIINYILSKTGKGRLKTSLCLSFRRQIDYDTYEEIKLHLLPEISKTIHPNILISTLIRFVALAANVYRLPLVFKSFLKSYRGTRAYLENYYRLSVSLKNVIEKERPDLITSFGFHSSIIALITKRLSKVKVPIFCSHRGNISGKVKHLPYPLLCKTLAKLLYKKANFHTAISNGVKQDIIDNFKVPEANIVTIYNGVDIGFVKTQSREPLEEEFREIFSDDGTLKVITVGRLAKQKGHEHLLKAFKEVRDKVNCRLFIVGKGKKRKYLESLSHKLGVHEGVHFLGWQKNPFKFVARCDLFVLSSLWEGFANVLIETMALGLPIISTDCPYGSSELLENGKYGILVPTGDDDALAKAMVEVLRSNDLRKELSRKSAERVLDFRVETMLSNYETLFMHGLR